MPNDAGQGTNFNYLKEFCDYWLDYYDWRIHEAVINRFSHHTVKVEGIKLHVIHEKGSGPKSTPLISPR